MATKHSTGSGALNVTLTASGNERIVLDETRLHLSSAATTVENFTITLDSVKGSQFDVLFRKQTMNGTKDYVCASGDQEFLAGDKILFEWLNSESKVWGLEVIYGTRC